MSNNTSLETLQKSFLRYEKAIHPQEKFHAWASSVLDQRLASQEEFAESDVPAIIQLIQLRDVTWASETWVLMFLIFSINETDYC